MQTENSLIRLGRCPGWPESSLGAQAFCRFWRATAHLQTSVYNTMFFFEVVKGFYNLQREIQFQDNNDEMWCKITIMMLCSLIRVKNVCHPVCIFWTLTVCQKPYEPLLDKPTKWPARPAKTLISLGIHPVWSESHQCAHWVAEDPMFLHADSEDSWSDWVDAQTGLSLRWAHRSFCWFCHEAAQFFSGARVFRFTYSMHQR